MKKVILALSVIGLMTACGSSSTEAEAPKTDSTAVVPACDTTKVVVDSVKTDSVAVSTPTTK